MSSLRILVVDDHEAIRRGLRSLLATRPEWTVCGEAADGFEAVEKAKTLRPNAVLMDISMPLMNGLDATRILRQEVPESKIIIVSQNDPNVVRRQAEEVDAAACVAKKDLADELLPTLDRLFASQNGEAAAGREGIASGEVRLDWLDGGGRLGQLMREYDWSQTSLGSIDRWPQDRWGHANPDVLTLRWHLWGGVYFQSVVS